MKASDQISKLAAQGRYHFSTREIAQIMGVPLATVRAALRRLKQRGLIATPYRGFRRCLMRRFRRFDVFSWLPFILVGALGCSDVVTSEDWRKSLRDLERQLSERHVNLFHSVSEGAFEKAVSDLDQRIPTLTPPEILVGFARLVAMVGDGHTSFFPGDQEKWLFHYYPIRLWSFPDGIYVIATTDEHAELFGRRLVRIDETSVEEAFRLISTTISADNDMEYEYTVPFSLIRPEMLHALGIAQSADQAEFVFEGGVRRTFQSMPEDEWARLDWRSANKLYEGRKPPSMRLDFLFATDLSLQHLRQRQDYWFTYVEEQQALYFQYNRCWDQKDGPEFKDVVEELFQYMDGNPVERLIVDVRQNSGGEPLTAEPLIEGLVQRPEFTADGRLFVLVGRRTFSAALTNAVHLRSRAGARIVGEPPRGKPNHPSEGRDIDLKRTKTWATVSTQFVERDPALGNAIYLPVDIEVAYSFEEYQNTQDPVLDAALNADLYQP